ncbi:hypothetical protein MHYP_G00136270 [Metynnis hypsauchen]
MNGAPKMRRTSIKNRDRSNDLKLDRWRHSDTHFEKKRYSKPVWESFMICCHVEWIVLLHTGTAGLSETLEFRGSILPSKVT